MSESFHWSETRELLVQHLFEPGWTVDDHGRSFERGGLRIAPPLVFPIDDARSLTDYVLELSEEPGAHTVVLMQAGAVSLGRFEAGEPVATRSFKRYVVRGTGRAQPTHLKTKGKSRYGSRLRLQNAQRLLEESAEKLNEWEEEFGPAERVYYNAPVRLWPMLFEAHPPPPFEKDGPHVKIPRDLPRPTTEVLLRAYRSLCYGRVEHERES